MMAVSYNMLLQNSLQFRRAYLAPERDGDQSAPLASTDILTLGLLWQITGAHSAWVDGERLSFDLLRHEDDGDARTQVKRAPPASTFSTLRILSCEAVGHGLANAGAELPTKTEPWSDSSCLTLLRAETGLFLDVVPWRGAPETVLLPLSSLAPSLWASSLYVFVTVANRQYVDAVLAALRATLGDPGLDPFVLYERQQRQHLISPEEIAQLREEVASLRMKLADVRDYSLRFAIAGKTGSQATHAQGSEGRERASGSNHSTASGTDSAIPDLETLKREIRYAHNQIAFLTTYLGGQVPDKISDRDLLARSPLFDAGWYAEKYRVRPRAATDHYLANGASGRFDPSPLFNSASYLAANPDVAAEKQNPLIHYLRHGADEGRSLSLQGDFTAHSAS